MFAFDLPGRARPGLEAPASWAPRRRFIAPPPPRGWRRGRNHFCKRKPGPLLLRAVLTRCLEIEAPSDAWRRCPPPSPTVWSPAAATGDAGELAQTPRSRCGDRANRDPNFHFSRVLSSGNAF